MDSTIVNTRWKCLQPIVNEETNVIRKQKLCLCGTIMVTWRLSAKRDVDLEIILNDSRNWNMYHHHHLSSCRPHYIFTCDFQKHASSSSILLVQTSFYLYITFKRNVRYSNMVENASRNSKMCDWHQFFNLIILPYRQSAYTRIVRVIGSRTAANQELCIFFQIRCRISVHHRSRGCREL